MAVSFNAINTFEGKDNMCKEEYIVYKVSTSFSNKVYIGQSLDFKRMIEQHINSAKNGKKGELYDEMRKYGIENFKFEILEVCRNKLHSEVIKAQYIKEYDSCINGYNKKQGNNIDDQAFYRMLGCDLDEVIERLKNMDYKIYYLKDFDKPTRNIIYIIYESRTIQKFTNIGIRLSSDFLDRTFELFNYQKNQEAIKDLYLNTNL